MTNVSLDHLAREIHGRPMRLVLAVAGGGSGAISGLLEVPGASRTVLGAFVPYAEAAMIEFLGSRPEEFCSPWTARAMAMTAYLKARAYDSAADTCGIACTASLATDRPKRGTHRVHLACQTANTTAALSLELDKGRRTRDGEEELVTALVLNQIAQVTGAEGRVAVPLSPREQPQSRQIEAAAQQQDLLAGRVRAVPLGAARKHPQPRAVFPGAFHPLHHGHRKMAEVARQILGHDVAYEVSIDNVDKPPLDFLEIDHRSRQFEPESPLWLTWAANFTDKAALFPGATFVVGADTILRIGQPRYYGNREVARNQAIDQLAAAGCRFLVFGRTVDGSFRTLSNLRLPESLAELCQEVPAHLFRDDTSSTQLRQQALPA